MAEWSQSASDLKLLDKDIQRNIAEHDNRTLTQKCRWLASNAATKDRMSDLMNSVKVIESMKRAKDGMYRPATLPVPHQRQQFRTVDCMTGLSWLCRYALFRGGGMSVDTLNEFLSQRMRPDETPSAAVSRLYNMADVLSRTGLKGLVVDHELNKLITNVHLKGGAFFTNTLMLKIWPVVTERLHNEKVTELSDPQRYRAIWTNVADFVFQQIHNTGSAEDVAMRKELNNRATTNMSGVGVYEVKHANQRSDGASGSGGAKKAAPGKAGNFDKKGGHNSNNGGNNNSEKGKGKGKASDLEKGDFKHFCEYHGGNPTHGTEKCFKIKNLAREARERNGKSDAVAGATTPSPGQNPTDKGSRPGSKYADNSKKQQTTEKKRHTHRLHIQRLHLAMRTVLRWILVLMVSTYAAWVS